MIPYSVYEAALAALYNAGTFYRIFLRTNR